LNVNIFLWMFFVKTWKISNLIFIQNYRKNKRKTPTWASPTRHHASGAFIAPALERWLGAPTIDLLMIAMPIMLIDFTGLSCLTKAHGRRGDDSGRWTAWASVWWAKWWWWCPGFFGRVDGDNWATRDPGVGGTLAMAGNDSSHIAFGVPGLVIAGGLRYWSWRDGFFGRNFNLSTPMATTPAGVVTLLGHHYGYLLSGGLRTKAFEHIGLDDSGALRRLKA
jgi:hypothetical protein